MLKEKGIHEGLWMLQVEFTMSAGNFGASEDVAIPTSFLGVSRLGMVQVPKLELSNLTVDAAEVNPAKTATKARRSATKAG